MRAGQLQQRDVLSLTVTPCRFQDSNAAGHLSGGKAHAQRIADSGPRCGNHVGAGENVLRIDHKAGAHNLLVFHGSNGNDTLL